MIRLNKLAKPLPLADNADNWTQQYLEHVHNDTRPPDSLKYKYRHTVVKDTIKLETCDKCAYCESKVTHAYPGDVEHILPRSKCPELVFAWENLTLACQACNNPKSDYHDPNAPLINPYTDDPESHLTFYGPMCAHFAADSKGQLTRHTLRLNRSALVDRRMDRLRQIEPLADRYTEHQGTPLGQVLKEELRREAAPDKQYSAMVKRYLSDHLGF